MGWFQDRLENIGKGSIKEAHESANDILVRFAPILDNAFNRASRIAHSLLNRFTINIEIKLNPYAKASSVEEDKEREE